MTPTSLVFNNKILDLESFVDEILTMDKNLLKIPSCEIHESSEFYSITLNSFTKSIHTFQIYYKNSFLIVQIRLKNNPKKILSTRMFFLSDININKISHTYYGDSTLIKVPKIDFFNA